MTLTIHSGDFLGCLSGLSYPRFTFARPGGAQVRPLGPSEIADDPHRTAFRHGPFCARQYARDDPDEAERRASSDHDGVFPEQVCEHEHEHE